MDALAELEKMATQGKKAVTLSPTFTLLDAGNLYLGKIGETLTALAKAATGSTSPMAYSVSSGGPSVFLSIANEEGNAPDTLTVTLAFDSRKLIATMTAGSQEGAVKTKEWMLNRIQGLPYARVAHLIWNTVSR